MSNVGALLCSFSYIGLEIPSFCLILGLSYELFQLHLIRDVNILSDGGDVLATSDLRCQNFT